MHISALAIMAEYSYRNHLTRILLEGLLRGKQGAMKRLLPASIICIVTYIMVIHSFICCVQGYPWKPTLASEGILWPPYYSTFTSKFPVPLPTEGSCLAGTTYKISSLSELYAHIPDLECLYDASLVPSMVPLGALYGRVLTVANTAFYNPLIEVAYQGDFVVQTTCKGKAYFLNILKVAGVPLSSGVFYIGYLPKQVDPGEHYDQDKGGLIMDFSVDINQLCPVESSALSHPYFFARKPDHYFRPFWSNLNSDTYPINLFMDVVRVAGRDGSDGCLILLGRSFMRYEQPQNVHEQRVMTSWYFTLKSCDPNLNVDFKVGDSLPPLATSFDYRRKAAIALLDRLQPLEAAKRPFAETFKGEILEDNSWHQGAASVPT